MKSVYFAADNSENCVKYLSEKSNMWYKTMQNNKYLEKIITSWAYYYGEFYDFNHQISFGGESGELVNFPVNHYRNIAQHILNIVTGSRPAFQCQSANLDRKSMIQAELGNDILGYYTKDKRLERKYRRAAEWAIIGGVGYVLTEWNSTKGHVVDSLPIDESKVARYDEEGKPFDEQGFEVKPTPIFSGDVECRTISPLEVFYDHTKQDSDLIDWYVVRSFINKFDLIAKYPELRDEILSISSQETRFNRITLNTYDRDYDIPVYQFFHRSTESVPQGRYVYYLTEKIILDDSILPYPDLPIQKITAAEVLGTTLNYTSMFDLLPVQESINSIYSTIMTNHNAFGVQNILNPRGNNVDWTQISGSLNWIDYDAQEGKPEALQLTKTSEHSYNLLNLAEKTMETLSGINSVARGNPESSLRSGTALALVQAQALQFMNGFQQSYIQLLEDCGTFLINLLKEFADQDRVISIAGEINKAKMKEFNNDDISSINRVTVSIGSPLLQNTAGRWQVAENLIQMGLITTPEKVLELLNTGSLSNLTKGMTDQLDVVRAENEALLKGKPVIALAIDRHSIHIREHISVLSDPDFRFDEDLVKRTMNHVMEHINLLRGTDPYVLQVIGEQPAPPVGGSQPNMEQEIPNQSGGMEQTLEMQDQGATPGMPEAATPPEGFEDLPQTPQEMMARQGQ